MFASYDTAPPDKQQAFDQLEQPGTHIWSEPRYPPGLVLPVTKGDKGPDEQHVPDKEWKRQKKWNQGWEEGSWQEESWWNPSEAYEGTYEEEEEASGSKEKKKPRK